MVYDKDFTPSMQQHTESSLKKFLQLKGGCGGSQLN